MIRIIPVFRKQIIELIKEGTLDLELISGEIFRLAVSPNDFNYEDFEFLKGD